MSRVPVLLVGARIPLGELRRDRVEFCLRLWQGRTCREPAEAAEVPGAAHRLVWTHRLKEGRLFGSGKDEASRQHADNLDARLAEPHFASDHFVPPAEPPSPQVVGDDRHVGLDRDAIRDRTRGRRVERCVVGVGEQPSTMRLNRHHAKECPRHARAGQKLRVAGVEQGLCGPPDQGHRLERPASRFPIGEVRCRDRGSVVRGIDTDLVNRDQPLGCGQWQAPPEDRAGQAEYGGVETEADAQCRNRAGGDAWSSSKLAHRVGRVAPQDVEVLAWGAVQDVDDRAGPQPPARRAPVARRLGVLVAEVVGHLIAVVAAKLGREHAQQRLEQPIGDRWTRHLMLLMAVRAAFWPARS